MASIRIQKDLAMVNPRNLPPNRIPIALNRPQTASIRFPLADQIGSLYLEPKTKSQLLKVGGVLYLLFAMWSIAK
jgi:hypothetical protein